MANTDLFVENFKSKLATGGTRANQFKVTLSGIEDFGASAEQAAFLCKATALPASSVAAIDVPFRGRIVKVAGDRTFEQWTITIINETDFSLRNAFEKWMNAMNSHVQNLMAEIAPSSYKKDMMVEQLSKNGDSLKTYNFVGVFPTNVSSIELGYDNAGIEEFTVTFDYDYWTSPSTTT